QGGVWVGRGQSAIDIRWLVNPAIAVPVGPLWIELATLVPQGQQACATVRIAKVRVTEVQAPIDVRDHRTCAGGKVPLRSTLVHPIDCGRVISVSIGARRDSVLHFRPGATVAHAPFHARDLWLPANGRDIAASQAAGGN